MALRSSIRRKPLSDETQKRLAAASAEEDDTADPEGDLASERYTRHSSDDHAARRTDSVSRWAMTTSIWCFSTLRSIYIR